MKQKVNVDLNQAENVECEECKGNYFMPVFGIKRLSALISPTGQETMVPIQMFCCVECKHINKEFDQF